MMSILFFFKYTATPDISPLPPPDPLPIKAGVDRRARHLEPHRAVRVLQVRRDRARAEVRPAADHGMSDEAVVCRSEEHTSELQSQSNLVCRLLLDKKQDTTSTHYI